MASPYTSQAISGYNTNPPPDDGSTGADNEVDWSMVKTKLGDPVKTLSEAINTAVSSGFGKVLGGVGVTSTAVSYTVLAADQGKLVRATASGITITTPDATDVQSPFVFAVLNNSGDTITFDGNGSQTIDGNASVTVAAGSGMVVFTDGTNWFTTGQQGTLVGKQLMYGGIINGTIVESNAANAVTFSLKTLAGTDPSATDPVLLCFRSATLATGNYVYRTVTAALTLVLPSGATMGVTNSVPFRLWIVLFDDGGTIRIGAINCVSGTNIYPLGRVPRVSSTTVSTGSDSAQVFYTDAGVTSKPYIVFAHADYESGLATAGSWNVDPTLQLHGHGVPLPGARIQSLRSASGAVQSGSTALPHDDTIPQSGEGDEFFTQAITPTSAANILEISAHTPLANSGANFVSAALFQDATAGALAVACEYGGAGTIANCDILYSMIAATGSSTTFKIRAGGPSGTTTLNGVSAGRLYGGVLLGWLKVVEIVG